MGGFVVIKILSKLQELQKRNMTIRVAIQNTFFIKINYSFLQFTLKYVNKNNV